MEELRLTPETENSLYYKICLFLLALKEKTQIEQIYDFYISRHLTLLCKVNFVTDLSCFTHIFKTVWTCSLIHILPIRNLKGNKSNNFSQTSTILKVWFQMPSYVCFFTSMFWFICFKGNILICFGFLLMAFYLPRTTL